MQLFTTQLSKWWKCRQYNVELVDVSNGNGLSMFIPTSDTYWDWKRGRISNEEFTHQYRARMRESWNQKREDWMAFLQQSHPLAIATYEPSNHFSHRYLLKDIFQMLCQNHAIEFYYYGEIE